MSVDLKRIRALTFDCYGTLVDWERGILDALHRWSKDAGAIASDDDLLALFARFESICEETTPRALYRDILRDVLHRIAAAMGVSAGDDDADRFAMSVGDWPVFADTPDALRSLGRGRKLIVVSNVDRRSFERTSPGLGVEFDAVVTAEDVGAYKPDQRMFEAAIRAASELGVEPVSILHVAQSLHHDIVPAQRAGLATCWIDRRGGRPGGATPPPASPVTPSMVEPSLAALAAAFDRAATA